MLGKVVQGQEGRGPAESQAEGAAGPSTECLSPQAPCRVHLAAVMQELKASLYLSGEDLFIPNCDTRGFYRRKQVRPGPLALPPRMSVHLNLGLCHPAAARFALGHPSPCPLWSLCPALPQPLPTPNPGAPPP